MSVRFEKLEKLIVGKREADYVQPHHFSARRQEAEREAQFLEAVGELTKRAQEFSSNKELWDRLLVLLEQARSAWSEGREIGAQQFLLEATVLVNRAIASESLKGVRLRLACVPLAWGTLLLGIQLVIGFVAERFQSLAAPNAEYFQYVWWGMLGGSTAVVWGIVKHGSDMTFDRAYVIWYLFKPPLGAVMGIVSVFLLQAGFLTLQGDASIKNTTPLVILAFLAGFSERFFVRLMDKVITSLLGGDTGAPVQSAVLPKRPPAPAVQPPIAQSTPGAKRKGGSQ